MIYLCFTWLKHIILHIHINAETEMEVDYMLSNQHMRTIVASLNF